MAQLSPQLPPELWVHVFGYLTATDKFSIRTCCKYFRELVDHASLWKDSTVVLSFKRGSYNPQFWATLRRRKTDSVVLRSFNAKDGKLLALSLPTLTTIVIDQEAQEGSLAWPGLAWPGLAWSFLKEFPNLKRLAIRSRYTPILIDCSTISQPEQLTHLSLCTFTSTNYTITNFSHFANLTSLVYHKKVASVRMFHKLGCLRKLKHLSWSMSGWHPLLHNTYFTPSDGFSGLLALCSLELVDYAEPSVSKDAMRFLPCLQSLAVFYKHDEMDATWEHDGSHLKTWLSDLHQLSTLVIVRGPHLHEYASSIPATVTSLTLCVGPVSSENMAAVAAQVPNLLHLHLVQWPPSYYEDYIGQIPELFPKLRTLKLRHEYVLKKDLLCLHKLQNLRQLEILDAYPGPRPHLSEVIHELQALTNYRIQVITSRRQRDPLACPCACLPGSNWW